jgi:hypothetical protein
MEIVNGRWVDEDGSRINSFNFFKWKDLSKKVTIMYGRQITYERILLIAKLSSFNNREKDFNVIANHIMKN